MRKYGVNHASDKYTTEQLTVRKTRAYNRNPICERLRDVLGPMLALATGAKYWVSARHERRRGLT